ncbi:DUF4492 domain-containing protein [Bacteroides sp. 224]|uniref:DUF4492 domain-containing protein n=1 Tax=Bacteroides sp. 224 TaxID=2302936 RepID=UPI0013D5B6A3|nr:DUF4492 domain-containing protein [Bacteroides sp. 224]NDV66728.1 DUF4492 domain-containing protein [Bacteroides sp. 224]
MRNPVSRIWNFYAEGFRSMTLGRTLWLIILVKLFIMFAVLKVFFFPNFLSNRPEGTTKEDFVAGELLQRSQNKVTEDNR